MDDDVSRDPHSRDHPLLRRRNSIATATVVVPAKLSLIHHHSSSAATTTSSSSEDLDLLSLKPTSQSYTSLKDLLPSAAVNSPRPSSAHSGSDICIRNRLVKQAAWAYLQPMSAAPGSTGVGFFHRVWPRIAAFFDFVRRSVIRVVDWTLRAIRVRSSRSQ